VLLDHQCSNLSISYEWDVNLDLRSPVLRWPEFWFSRRHNQLNLINTEAPWENCLDSIENFNILFKDVFIIDPNPSWPGTLDVEIFSKPIGFIIKILLVSGKWTVVFEFLQFCA
jgi:hypothetical protein